MKPINKWYWIVPLIVGIVFTLYFLWRSWFEDRVWDSYILYIFLGFIVPSVLSLIVFLFNNLSGAGDEGIKYNDRAFCEFKIRQEFKCKSGVNLVPFTGITFSGNYVGFYGKEGMQKVKIFVSMWRNFDHVQGGYYLVLMNMEEGKEDDLSIDKVALNHTREQLWGLIDRLCNAMAEHQEIIKPNIISTYDPLSGRQMTKTSYDNLQQGKVPKDVDVD